MKYPERRSSFREAAALTALSLGMLALPNTVSAIEKPTFRTPLAELQQEKGRPLARDLQALLRQVNTPEHPVARLIGMPHKELADYHLGKNRVRIVQIGGELKTGPLTKSQIEQMKLNMKMFDQYARTAGTFKLPIVEVNDPGVAPLQGIARTGVYHLQPREKDKVIFVVPSAVNIGKDIQRTGTSILTFTSLDGGREIASFVRPDSPDRELGVITEACQANLQATISNPREIFPFNLTSSQFYTVNILGQEMICNSLARMVYAQRQNQSYVAYNRYENKFPIQIYTNQPKPGVNAFLFTSGRLNRSAYNKHDLTDHIPKTVSESMIYRAP